MTTRRGGRDPSCGTSYPCAVTASARPTIAHLLATADRPLFSFELFPPRNTEDERILWHTVRRLEQLRPDFVSVTYGASGSTRGRTITITERIARDTTLRTVAHLTCASQHTAQLRHVVGAYAAAGVSDILAIRGDMPDGPLAPWVPHPEGLGNATELVSLVKELGDFCVGVAAFPDPHPERRDPELDADLLVAKARAGADYAITQLFFDPEAYLRLVERVRARDCDLPIIPGIQPILSLRQIRRFEELSGQAIPEQVVRRLSDAPADRVRAEGIAIATELCQQLLELGAPGLHFFTQNRSSATREIYARLRPTSDRG